MFRKWCSDNGFCNGTKLSHVLMDGGVLSIPFDRLNEFYKVYVESVSNGEKIYVVEQKTDNYNFFMDLDYKDDDPLLVEYIKSICTVICDKVSKFGGKDALISVAEPKNIGDLIKTGIHINWPGFVVNKQSALAIREHVINTMNLAYGSKDWNDIIDLSVYGSSGRNTKGSGFRMPWSYKKAKHEKCGGQGCKECRGTGKTSQGYYLPVFMYKRGPVLSILEQIDGEPSVKIMEMATLRTENEDPVIVEGSYKKQEGSFTALQIKDEFKNEEVLGNIETFVRRHLEGQEFSKITKMYKHKNQFLVSTNSKYCENKKCEHNSNHVWFHIIGDTISQKCFSTTNILRKYGFCKDFNGRKHQLPSKITKKLYEGEKITKYEPKPKPKSSETKTDQSKIMLKQFLEKYVVKNTEINISAIKKDGTKKFTIETDYSCHECKKTNIAFKIVKKEIQQKCSCSCRKHRILDKIADSL